MQGDDRRVAIEAGTRLICPNPKCRVHIATFRYGIYRGIPNLGLDVLTFEPDQRRENGSSAICFTCAEPFMRTEAGLVDGKPASWYAMHTDAGWVRV